jgi:hypothetical protein
MTDRNEGGGAQQQDQRAKHCFSATRATDNPKLSRECPTPACGGCGDGLQHVEFRQGVIEDLPIEEGWTDVVISNGSSTSAPTSGEFSPESRESYGRPDGYSLPALRVASLSRKQQSAKSTFGPIELPVACRVEAGSGCWKRAVS